MQKKISMKDLYLLLVISLGLIGLGLGSTYALFVSKSEITNPITFVSNLSYTGDVLETVSVLVPSRGVETVTLNVSNDSGSSLNYVSWYIDDGYDISVNSIGGQNNGTTPSGALANGGSATITVEVVNRESRSVVVLIGVTSGTDSIVLGSNMNSIESQNILMNVAANPSASSVFLRYDDDGTTGLLRNKVRSITFVDNISASTGAGMTSIDVSLHQDGSVIMWYGSPSSGLYDVYIGGKNGKVAIKNMDYLLMYMTNLVSINFNNAINSEANTTMYRSFAFDQKLTTINFEGFSTMNVTAMTAAFGYCAFSEIDLSGFDTSKVTKVDTMFFRCTNLKTLDLSSWDTSNFIDVRGLFNVCSSLISVNLDGWDVSNVTTMSYMFGMCHSLETLNITHFDTSNVTDMSFMFGELRNLDILDLSNFDTSKVTTMEGMFQHSYFISLDLSGFDTSSLNNSSKMFYDCSNLESIDFSGANFTKLSTVADMFSGVNANLIVTVKDATQKTLLMNKTGMASSKITIL